MNGLDLLNEFVDQVLNKRRSDLVPTLFAGNYVDHDPIDGASTTRVAIELLVQLLVDFGGDTQFVIERSVEDGNHVWYKLYGEGVLDSQLQPAVALREREHLVSTAVGVFRVAAGQFVERWGVVTARASRWNERS